ncbi:cytochrome c3 family protein [Anaeromyxobacter paludicola]|uniref:Cytochrome c n=1 Tax=Anaeromyxobacter paludicola TaxID=2918171 RepID=A0ABM7XBN2_9BACT|nr:cytochrome c3 family protein [Anaeromyxobacter paludicola]BDG09248.1 cytochrome c [Anaeromyxobacter paludicola]
MRSRTPLVLLAAALLAAGAARAAGPDKLKLKPGANGKVCLDCHSGDFDAVLKRKFVHTPVRSRDCTGCHSPHASNHGKMLSAEPGRTCAACHQVVPEKPRSTHKPVADGGCLTCHDPHASGFKNNLVKAPKDLCAGCHKAVVTAAASVKFKHRPVEQDCATCHDPHGSARGERLLKGGVPELCVGCHKMERPALVAKHQNYPVAGARCTSCHDPHGSNVRGMLYDNVHPPVAKAMCAQCHEPPGSARKFQPKQAGVTLCKGCHAQKVAGMLDRTRVHWAVSNGDACLSCHSPHAGKQKGMLKANMVTVCGSCHADTVKRQALSETKHKPIADGQCTRCHDPHGAPAALMMQRPETIELCGTCHDWQKHSTHPIGAKHKDPRNPNLILDCLSCHRAHGTEYKHMNPFPTTTELCTKCHEKFKR